MRKQAGRTISVETFSTPGCAKCAQAHAALQSIAEGMERVVWRKIHVLEELDYAVKLGVLTPPAIAIDGELAFPALPSPQRFRRELARRLEALSGADHPPEES